MSLFNKPISDSYSDLVMVFDDLKIDDHESIVRWYDDPNFDLFFSEMKKVAGYWNPESSTTKKPTISAVHIWSIGMRIRACTPDRMIVPSSWVYLLSSEKWVANEFSWAMGLSPSGVVTCIYCLTITVQGLNESEC